MPVQEFLFTVDPRTDKNLSSINEQLRSLTNREDPLTLDNFISFDVIGYSGLRSVVIRVTMEVNAFYARTTFPVNGAAFSQTAAPQAIKLVFNSKVDEGSITGTSIKYNGTNVAASNITLESDGYTLINELGADVLRLWIASADFSAEMTVSDEILKRAGESYRRIRNTARYFLSNIDGFDPQQHAVEHSDLLALDRWAIDCAAELQDEIIQDYDNFQFHQIFFLFL